VQGLLGIDEQHRVLPEGPLRNMAIALQRMGPLHNPPADVEGVAVPVPPIQLLSTYAADVEQLLESVRMLHWTGAGFGPFQLFSVKTATDLQLAPVVEERGVAHRAYAAQALALSDPLTPAVQEARTASFIRSLPTVWKLPWENKYKEAFWRLAVNGVVGAGGHDICNRQQCCCGYCLTPEQIQAGDSTLNRQHVFWDCPVALAVRQEVQRGTPPGVLYQPRHVWLLQPPSGVGIRPVVWRVVALAALEAMAYGRRCLWWHVHQHPGSTAESSLQFASNRAVLSFRLALHDFTRVAVPVEKRGWGHVGPEHPFLGVSAGGVIVVTFPA
jgi:hypothetical protein